MVLFVQSVSRLISRPSCSSSLRILYKTKSCLLFETKTQSTFSSKTGIPNVVKINKSMSLRYCNLQSEVCMSTNEINKNETNNYNNNNDDEINNGNKNKRLAVIMSWMLSKEAHLEKYRRIYFKRGFDVLTVRTSPLDLILPTVGSQKIAINLLEYLKSQISNYPTMIVHGFSVGAYQWGEMLLNMKKELETVHVDAKCEAVRNNLKGAIFDSAVDFEGVPYGLSRAMFAKGFLGPITEQLLRFYMRIFYYIATQHYMNASRAFFNTPLRCPALLLVSNEDKLGNPAANEKVAKRWREIGINVSWKCWDDSDHVLHFHKYPKDYEDEIDSFLDKINLNK